MQISHKNASKLRTLRAAYIAGGINAVDAVKAADVVTAVLRSVVADEVGKTVKADAGFVNALVYSACVEIQPELIETEGGKE